MKLLSMALLPSALLVELAALSACCCGGLAGRPDAALRSAWLGLAACLLSCRSTAGPSARWRMTFPPVTAGPAAAGRRHRARRRDRRPHQPGPRHPGADRGGEPAHHLRDPGAPAFPTARLVFTGGSGRVEQGVATEAHFARILLAELGVPPDRVVFEDQSRTTAENATLSQGPGASGAGRDLGAGHFRQPHAARGRRVPQGSAGRCCPGPPATSPATVTRRWHPRSAASWPPWISPPTSGRACSHTG